MHLNNNVTHLEYTQFVVEGKKVYCIVLYIVQPLQRYVLPDSFVMCAFIQVLLQDLILDRKIVLTALFVFRLGQTCGCQTSPGFYF